VRRDKGMWWMPRG